MAQGAPLTVLYYPNRLTGVARRLEGVGMDIRCELVSVGRWWITPGAHRGEGAR
jgi:hypothetical protein